MRRRGKRDGVLHERVVGVEHEYRVSEGGAQVDFRRIIERLPIDGRRIDPGDAYAFRTTTGLKITCDEADAEIATPTVPLAAGVTGEIASWVGHGGDQLSALLRDELDIEGFSTHISVKMDNDLVLRAAGMFSRTFAPALMLLMDSKDSPGLLVRPRRNRLELGGEFVKGEHLAAATMLAAGGAIVCERAAASDTAKQDLAPPVHVEVVRAVTWFGWYIARDAFGVDLYDKGRDTILKRESVGEILAQRSLEEAWAAARSALPESLDSEDLAAADDIVAGRLAIPLETDLDLRPPSTHSLPAVSPLGEAMINIRTPALTLRAVAATWDFVVFATSGEKRFVSVPATMLGEFLSSARTGRWDATILASNRFSRTEKTLSTFLEASSFGVWGDFRFSRKLAPPERDVEGVERFDGR